MPALFNRRLRRRLWHSCLMVLTVSLTMPALANSFEVTDLAGRKVLLPGDPQRVILGEGRLLYTLAALQPDDPFQDLVGWRDELIRFDEDVWHRLRQRFPHAEQLARFGKAATGEFDLEHAIALNPDVIVFDLSAWPALREGSALDTLETADVAVVFVDFLTQADQHMVPSLRLMGKIFAAEARAETLINMRQQALEEVAERLPEPLQRPDVLIETAAGLHPECCRSVGDDNLGRVVRLAGGNNIAAERLPNLFGQLHIEWILSRDPDVIIQTGGDWQVLSSSSIPLGYDVSAQETRAAMRELIAARPGWSTLKAVEEGRVHALWHLFYNTPFQFIAVQQVAKWLHPEAMADLDPAAAWQSIHETLLPYSLEGTFWADLVPAP